MNRKENKYSERLCGLDEVDLTCPSEQMAKLAGLNPVANIRNIVGSTPTLGTQ